MNSDLHGLKKTSLSPEIVEEPLSYQAAGTVPLRHGDYE